MEKKSILNIKHQKSEDFCGLKISLEIFKQKFYKQENAVNISNLRIVSMIPGDREVAGCFIFSSIFGDII